jgi:hypothetical protein
MSDPAAARILEGLTAAQVAAVTHEAGPLLVVAGAGGGTVYVLDAWCEAENGVMLTDGDARVEVAPGP